MEGGKDGMAEEQRIHVHETSTNWFLHQNPHFAPYLRHRSSLKPLSSPA